MTGLDIDAAKEVKWTAGRRKYGEQWGGLDPMEELDDELIDALNYCDELERRGFPMAKIAADIRRLCELVRDLASPVI